MTFRGTSVSEFFYRFPNETACLTHLVETRWGNHSPCPRCGQIGFWSPITGTKKFMHRCRAQVSPTEGTIFYRSNLSLMAWFYGLLLFSNASIGMRSSFIRRQMGIGIRSAHRLCNQIRTHFAAAERAKRLGGPGKRVHIDEVHLRYLVDPKKNRRAAAIVLGIECEGQVLCGIIKDRRRSTIIPIIERIVRPGSTLVTDGLSTYACLKSRGWDHISVNHSRGFSNRYGDTTNAIEIYWSSMRRSLRSYRQVGKENLWRFLAEIEFTYNRRHSQSSPFDELVGFFPEISDATLPEIRGRYVW